ncbi:LuxR C-terminal-related transcriptional regulator [Prevotella sp. 10(H)]|uniref:helix-turn-helix transcriptional regulator n=1 Tax=Prevotella sp. 10(H) TaxID=1158294 RepID=UPI0004A6ACFE|nr:LuxR C-terminal-related transcriptional regulator [Prevotella sp. 10(H)]
MLKGAFFILLLLIFSICSSCTSNNNYEFSVKGFEKVTEIATRSGIKLLASSTQSANPNNFQSLPNEGNTDISIQMLIACGIILLLIIAIFGIIHKAHKKDTENKAALAKEQKKVLQLQNTLDKLNEKEDSFRRILFQHFDIFKKVALLKNTLRNEEEKKHGARLLKKMYEIVYNQDRLDWNMLFDIMNQLYKGFPDALRKKYSHLDETEIRICCLEYGGLNNSQIADIMEFSLNTIQMKKSIIRKKLGIEGYGNLVEFLHKNVN